MANRERGLILALDTRNLYEAESMIETLEGVIRNIKVGPRIYAEGGMRFIQGLVGNGYRVFLDLKLHDIPNTVAFGVEYYADQGLWMLTLHTGGGREMLERARAARDRAATGLKLLGVTVLTSLNDRQWAEINPGSDLGQSLLARGKVAEQAGIDGLVCSPQDLGVLSEINPDMLRVVPGIRMGAGTVKRDDQVRTSTPAQAFAEGAHYLVVGRPILEASDPKAAAEGILSCLDDEKSGGIDE